MKVIKELPEYVRSAIRELVCEPEVTSIWLIGSRANHCARTDSDWDLLVFFDVDPMPTQRQHKQVDVLRTGPSKKVLLDGQPKDFEFCFSNFQWHQLSEGQAQYRGKKFIDYPTDQAIDYNAPRFERPVLSALRVWWSSTKN